MGGSDISLCNSNLGFNKAYQMLIYQGKIGKLLKVFKT